MTILTHWRFVESSQTSQHNLTTMKAIALMVFLLCFLTSTFAHAEHLVAQDNIAEQQDCQLCNQGIDTPPDIPQLKETVVTRYNVFAAIVTTADFTSTQFIQPPLRAPPCFS